jgi:superfamily II DNA/RNA helicase
MLFFSLSLNRELAYQIADQFRVFGKPLGLKDCVITGGMGEWNIISLNLFFF